MVPDPSPFRLHREGGDLDLFARSVIKDLDPRLRGEGGSRSPAAVHQTRKICCSKGAGLVFRLCVVFYRLALRSKVPDRMARMRFRRLVKAVGLGALAIGLASIFVPFVLQYVTYPISSQPYVFGIDYIAEKPLLSAFVGLFVLFSYYFEWKRPGS